MNRASSGTTRRTALSAGVLATSVACLLPLAPTASAHGTVITPQTRNYGCLQRWGSTEPNEAQDPMCYRTYHENPNAIGAWKGPCSSLRRLRRLTRRRRHRVPLVRFPW